MCFSSRRTDDTKLYPPCLPSWGQRRSLLPRTTLNPTTQCYSLPSISCVMVRAVNGSGTAQTQNQVGIDGHSLGKVMAFSAVAPSQQPGCDAQRAHIAHGSC